MARILIIDDDAQLRNSFEKLLCAEGHVVKKAPSGEIGLEAVRDDVPDLAIVDVRLPGMDGLQTFKAIHEIEPRLPAIIMTAYGTTDTAIEATKLGAFDYVLKPFDIPEMLMLIERAVEAGRMMRSRVTVDASLQDLTTRAILGRSKAMQEVFKAVGRVASTDATVLLRGESGTGKELVAQAIFHHSVRSDKPFSVINCVAIPETLLESELFGYEKGAFTGAKSRKIGKIEYANHGTVFLDEIGDMPVSIQAKVLRLIQERSIERLGGSAPVEVNVRIIAATNRDLEEAMTSGTFREDLYYRLNVVSINLPPLRERDGDIPVLADYFLRKFSEEMGVECPGFTKEALGALDNYRWPGNVRELANVVQKALIFGSGAPISMAEVLLALKEESSSGESLEQEADASINEWVRSSLTSGRMGARTFVDLVDRFSSMVITEALNQTGGNRSKAARLLGLSRPTLLAKMDKYGIRVTSRASSES